ncbi:MAG: metal-dependent hydrolase [Nanoarchaeota archaeon]
MPHAAAHIIVPLVLMSLIRDRLIKKKGRKHFPLHYVLIAGIAGLIPDIDIIAFWILHFFGFTIQEVHRTFMHSVFIPIILLFCAAIFSKNQMIMLKKHQLKVQIIFLMLAFGSLVHLLMDAILQGQIMPFYPFSNYPIGLNLFGYLPKALEVIAAPSLDAGLLIIYII